MPISIDDAIIFIFWFFMQVGVTNVSAVRFLIQSLLPILPFVRNSSRIAELTAYQWIIIALTGVLFAGGSILGLEAFKYIPISDAVTIFNCQSVIVLIAGSIWLKERIRLLDVFTVVFVLVGVMLVSQPDFIFGSEDAGRDPLSSCGYTFSIVVCFTSALITCIIRRVKDAGSVNIMVIQGISATAFIVFATPFMHDMRDPQNTTDACLLVGTGLCYFVARYMVTWSLTLEPSMTVSVLLTTEILFSLLYQVCLFHVYPNFLNVVGIAFVISSIVTLTLKYQIYQAIDKWRKKSAAGETNPLLVGHEPYELRK